LSALLLDVSKVALPVGLAYQAWGWKGREILPSALGALLGSVPSPFLKFHGSQSLSVSLGIWIGLTTWTGPLIILASLGAIYAIHTSSGWAVAAALLSLSVFLSLTHVSPAMGTILLL
jgi:glycerol-3-phosphate acyltransferase PlsY